MVADPISHFSAISGAPVTYARGGGGGSSYTFGAPTGAGTEEMGSATI